MIRGNLHEYKKRNNKLNKITTVVLIKGGIHVAIEESRKGDVVFVSCMTSQIQMC